MKKSKKYRSAMALLMACCACLVLTCSVARAQEFKSITPEQLKKMIESKADIVVVDNQPKEAYDIEHIPGAVNFPWAMDVRGPVNLPRDRTLVFYCACTHEEDSTDMANQLAKKLGFRNIVLLAGGWLRWQELGYPAEKSGGK